MTAPAPPPGFQLQQPTPRRPRGMFAQPPKRDPNLLKPLLDAGIEPTNGYRTPADIQRLSGQGYKPARKSLHLDGDAVDLTPGKSGMTLRQVEDRAAAVAGGWPGGKVVAKGDHVHVQLPGWGMAPGTPGTPNSGLPPLPGGFTLQQRGSLTAGNWTPGAVQDGDTFKLPDSRNARLSGADAFELSQQGRKPDGALVSVGVNSQAALRSALPGSAVNFTGGQTFNRPLVTLDQDGKDLGLDLIRSGHALATPEYLKRDPRFTSYMEAERLARQNLLEGHGTNAETPKQFRRKDGPWAGAEPGEYGKGGIAVFSDERTPFQGLRPEIRDGYLAIWNDARSKPEDLLRFAKESGFSISEQETRKAYSTRFKGGDVPDGEVSYRKLPKPVTNPGDGAVGAFTRGIGDPINMLDEAGAIVDTVGLTSGRENLWNSERRFGDILWNNIDQNRSILAYDDDKHPVARIGGQLASGVVFPIAGGARTVGTLTRVGAVEGGLAGFGAGEGGIVDRLPNAAVGAILGSAGGYALGRVADDVGRRLSVVRGGTPAPVAREAGFVAAPILNSGAQNAGPTPAARSQPIGGSLEALGIGGQRQAGAPNVPSGFVLDAPAPTRPAIAAMQAEDGAPTLVGPDLSAGMRPPAPGTDAPFGMVRPTDQPLAAPEIARLAEDVDPRSVLPSSSRRETPEDYLSNINLDRLERPEDVAQLIDQVTKRVGGFDPAMRGKITQEQTSEFAAELGLTPERLLTRRTGQALNAEQLYAARALAQKSREEVADLAKRAVGGSDEDLLAFRKAWVRHVAIEEQVSGATAEAGRALQQFRMLAKAGDARGDAVKAYLKGAGGRESIEDAARAIVDLIEDPAKASHFMREGLKATWLDKFNELWVNSLLSGPKTHVVNFVGNALTAIYIMPEQALTAGIGMVTRSADRSFAGEVAARVSGLANSAVEGLRNARVAFATGEALDDTSKIDAIHQKAISGRKGEILRIPTRALTAADEFWKTINRNAELHALAYRRSMHEAGTSAERNARYEQLLRNPDEGMVKAADQAARYYTFQKDLGEYGQSIQRLSNKLPGGKILMPFVRTPINLLKFAGERSVFAPLSTNVRAELAKGGRARDEVLAKITLGSGLSTAAVVAAMDGKVTGGGPTDRGERTALLQSGWQPYSIKVGDRWVSYQRFDPLSLLFGAAADFAEIGRYARPQEADKFALALSMAVAKNITSKTWLSGLSDAFDVLSDPQRYGEGYLRRLAGSLAVPAVSSQVAQSVDPYMREARTILDSIKARVPFLSNSLPVRRNIWGEEVKRGDAVGPDLVSPIYGTNIDPSPMSQEIARLRVPLSMPKRQVTVRGVKVDLSAEQYDTLAQLAGKPARTYLEGYVATPEYKQMSDPERVEAVREIMKDFRKSGLDALKGMYPELGGNLAPGDIKPLPQGFMVQGQRKPSGAAAPLVSGGAADSFPPPGFELVRP